MKTLFSLILALFTIVGQAQKVADYAYIQVNEHSSDLNLLLKSILTEKGYHVLTSQRATWPSETQLNPCLVLNADANIKTIETGSHVQVLFKDCNQTTVFEYTGESTEDPSEETYKNVLKSALSTIGHQAAQVPNYRQEETKVVNITTKTEKEHPSRDLFRKYSQKSDMPKIDLNQLHIDGIYTLNGATFFKSNLQNDAFILVSEDKKEIAAYFFPSSKQNIYYVHLVSLRPNTRNLAIGYFDGSKLSYEYLSDNNKPVIAEFSNK